MLITSDFVAYKKLEGQPERRKKQTPQRVVSEN
jgi:hypothetical protein